ncbi:MAG: site-2 protease family protein [Methanotrichaceae archaeon]
MEFPLQLTLYDKMFFVVLVVTLHWTLAIKLSKSQRLKKFKISNWGPVIFFRTTRGLNLIDRLSGPKRLWKAAITAGIPLVILGMFLFFVMLILLDLVMMRAPPMPSIYTSPRNVLLIPGINQFIPIWYGWIALLVTMIVHEFSHGILCRVEGIKVNSMGLAILMAPVAAFVEPDEKELFGTEKKEAIASRSARIRILSAGVIANFMVAAIAIMLFFGPVIGAIAPHDRVVVVDVVPDSLGDIAGFQERMILMESNGIDVNTLSDLCAAQRSSSRLTLLQDDREVNLKLKGPPDRGVMIAYVFEDSPAERSGLKPNLIISKIDGVPTPNWVEFRNYMNTTRNGQEVTIQTNQGTYHAKLTSNPDGTGTGFIGVGFAPVSIDAVYISGVTFATFPASSFLAELQNLPYRGPGGLLTLMGLPFTGLSGFTEMGFLGFIGWISNFFEPAGWAESLGNKVFWIANVLLWIGLINLYAGFFNCLPAVPLDGGHIFRDILHLSFQKIFHSEIQAEKMTAALVTFMSWLIFSSLVFMIIAPYLAHGFGG